jgi:regulator of sirC expression with transglutaminase-like and TPR domain
VHWLERFTDVVRRDNVPLDEAAMVVAASCQPRLDIDAELRRLDALAETMGTKSAEGVRLGLFVSRRFAGNTVDYYDPENSYLNRVLDRGVGIPISLAVLALECSRRLDVKLDAVGLPGHFLIGNPATATFIDPFNGGMELSAADCQVRFRRNAPPGATWSDDYLQPLASEAIVYRMLTNLLLIHRQRRDVGSLASILRLRVSLPSATDAERIELEHIQAKLN